MGLDKCLSEGKRPHGVSSWPYEPITKGPSLSVSSDVAPFCLEEGRALEAINARLSAIRRENTISSDSSDCPSGKVDSPELDDVDHTQVFNDESD